MPGREELGGDAVGDLDDAPERNDTDAVGGREDLGDPVGRLVGRLSGLDMLMGSPLEHLHGVVPHRRQQRCGVGRGEHVHERVAGDQRRHITGVVVVSVGDDDSVDVVSECDVEIGRSDTRQPLLGARAAVDQDACFADLDEDAGPADLRTSAKGGYGDLASACEHDRRLSPRRRCGNRVENGKERIDIEIRSIEYPGDKAVGVPRRGGSDGADAVIVDRNAGGGRADAILSVQFADVAFRLDSRGGSQGRGENSRGVPEVGGQGGGAGAFGGELDA